MPLPLTAAVAVPPPHHPAFFLSYSAGLEWLKCGLRDTSYSLGGIREAYSGQKEQKARFKAPAPVA